MDISSKVEQISRYSSDASINFGEVFTPVQLIEEMCDLLPTTIWQNPEAKFLDPCAGKGNMPVILVLRLMIGLKDVIKNEHERYKHILENQIYMCELQEESIRDIQMLFNQDGDLKLNLVQGDFLKTYNYFNKQFDVVIANPPYNIGLLDRNTDICKGRNKNAAKTRIDAAFVVQSFELLKEDGYSVFVWPYSWTQLPSWAKFRNWMRTSGLNEIRITKTGFKNASVNVAITVQKKNFLGQAIYTNPFRNSIFSINWDYDIIPNVLGGEVGFSIFCKEQNYPHKLKYTTLGKVKDNDIFLCHATGYGLGDKATQASLSPFDLSEKTKNIVGPIKKTNFGPDSIPAIIFDNTDHLERYVQYHSSALYKFIIFQRKADFHNTQNNLGQIPDVCKYMEGRYSDQKAYDILGLTEEEIRHIESQMR
jgi:16S rRNA G966 N2-methylase RsmD